MAGAPLSVFLSSAPKGARLAIARPDDPDDKAIVVFQPKNTVPALQTPGAVGSYELRLTVEKDGVPGFLDFEEEPETVMSLAAAQARDVWLLFFQITAQARLPETPQQAFDAYRALAPAAVVPELRKIVGFFRFTIAPLRLFRRIHLGGDGKRLLQAMEFFDANLDVRTRSGH